MNTSNVFDHKVLERCVDLLIGGPQNNDELVKLVLDSDEHTAIMIWLLVTETQNRSVIMHIHRLTVRRILEIARKTELANISLSSEESALTNMLFERLNTYYRAENL